MGSLWDSQYKNNNPWEDGFALGLTVSKVSLHGHFLGLGMVWENMAEGKVSHFMGNSRQVRKKGPGDQDIPFKVTLLPNSLISCELINTLIH